MLTPYLDLTWIIRRISIEKPLMHSNFILPFVQACGPLKQQGHGDGDYRN